MEIDAYDLSELLRGEIDNCQVMSRPTRLIGNPRNTDTFIELQWGDGEWATLEWAGNQEFWVHHADADDMYQDCTISVDEILDIVL